MYDELNVKSTTITDFRNTDTESKIIVHLVTRYLDCLLNKKIENLFLEISKVE